MLMLTMVLKPQAMVVTSGACDHTALTVTVAEKSALAAAYSITVVRPRVVVVSISILLHVHAAQDCPYLRHLFVSHTDPSAIGILHSVAVAMIKEA
jgi:hypothetical protein